MYNPLLSGDGFFMYLRWFVFNAPDDYRFRSANIAFIIIKLYLYLYMCILNKNIRVFKIFCFTKIYITIYTILFY